jgi:hypothetical protein
MTPETFEVPFWRCQGGVRFYASCCPTLFGGRTPRRFRLLEEPRETITCLCPGCQRIWTILKVNRTTLTIRG